MVEPNDNQNYFRPQFCPLSVGKNGSSLAPTTPAHYVCFLKVGDNWGNMHACHPLPPLFLGMIPDRIQKDINDLASYPIYRIPSHIVFLGYQNRIRIRWILISIPYTYVKSYFWVSGFGYGTDIKWSYLDMNCLYRVWTICIGFWPSQDGWIPGNIHPVFIPIHSIPLSFSLWWRKDTHLTLPHPPLSLLPLSPPSLSLPMTHHGAGALAYVVANIDQI